MIDLTPVPNRLTRPNTIDDDADSFFGKLPQFANDLVALQANMNAIAAGGAYTFGYTFDTGTADADPGAGKVRVNSALSASGTTVGSQGLLYIDVKSASAQDLTAVLDSFDDSTSLVKGALRLMKTTDPSKWVVFDLTAVTTATNYRKLTVVVVASSGAAPFVANDPLVIQFTPAGDKGEQGPSGSTLTGVLHVADVKASGTNGGTPTVGTNTRTLNTVLRNTIGGVAALASNQITLAAGTYRVIGSAPANGVGFHQAYLYNVTAGATIVNGTSEYDAGNNSRSDVLREFVLSAQSVLELRHYCQTSSGSLGGAVSSGQGELYSQLLIEKVA